MDLIERLIDEADGYGDGPVVVHDIEGLLALLREAAAEIERLRAEVEAVWAAMPRDSRYLDPPDGGCVPLHEQVRRMAVDAARDDGIQRGNEGIDIGTWTPPSEPERPLLPGHEHEMNKRRDWKESA